MFLKRFKEVWDAKGGLAALDLADQRFVEGAVSEEERQSIAARISELALHDLFGGNPLFEENPARSLPVLRRMLDFAEGHFGKQHYSVADVSNAFGRMLMAERRDAEAEEHLLRALAVNEVVNGHRFYSTYSTHELGNLVGRYEAAKRLDLAAQLLERQVAILGAKAANPRAARALLYLGKAYAQQGRLGDAEANLREALTFFEKQPNTKGLNYNLYAQIARDLLAGIPDPK
jgi:tetratricopeptide (TPR) repeat protein